MNVAIYGPLLKQETGPSAVCRGIVDGVSTHHEVTLYTTGDDTHDVETVHVEGSTDSVVNFYRTKRRVARHVRENNHDVFHSLAGIIDGADIATVQGIWADLQMLMWAPHIISPREFVGANIYSLLKTIGYHRTQKLVAISPLVADQCKRYLRRKPDHVVPLGIFDKLRSEPAMDDDLNVLVPGLVEPIKGQHRVLQHLDPDDDRYTLDIVGSVNERYAQRFPQWSHRLHGYVDDIYEFYRKADIVLLPSEHDNYPTTAIEAIGNGCVVIITNTCGFSRFQETQECEGIFVVDNGVEMAKCFHSLIERPDDIPSLQRAAYDLSTSMTWENIGKTYSELYQTLEVD